MSLAIFFQCPFRSMNYLYTPYSGELRLSMVLRYAPQLRMLTQCKARYTHRDRENMHKHVQGTRAQRTCASTTHALAGTASLPEQTGRQTRKQIARYAHTGAKHAHTKGNMRCKHPGKDIRRVAGPWHDHCALTGIIR